MGLCGKLIYILIISSFSFLHFILLFSTQALEEVKTNAHAVFGKLSNYVMHFSQRSASQDVHTQGVTDGRARDMS